MGPAVVSMLLAVLLAAPGAALLQRWWRERQEPELWLGLFFASAALGLPIRITTGQALALQPGADLAGLNLLGHAVVTVAPCALYVFVWRVFHPESRLARRAALTGCGAALLTTLAVFAFTAGALERHPSVALANLTRGLCMPWAFAESVRYARMMRRRLTLGLADPMVANRFLLWSLWTGAITFLPLVVLAVRVAAHLGGDGVHAALLAWLLPVLRPLALSAVATAFACIWLSFFPPALYVARIRARA